MDPENNYKERGKKNWGKSGQADCLGFPVIAPKASAEGACIFSKLVTVERV